MKTEIRYAPLELRDDPTRQSQGILHGVLMRYGDVAPRFNERFEAGALYWDDNVNLVEQHNRAATIQKIEPRLDGDRIRLEIPMIDTTRGRDILAMVRNGALTGFSPEFIAERETRDAAGVRVIQRAKLVRVGVVDEPAYGESVASVRADDTLRTKERQRWRNQWL